MGRDHVSLLKQGALSERKGASAQSLSRCSPGERYETVFLLARCLQGTRYEPGPRHFSALPVAKAAGVRGVDRSLFVTHVVTGRGKKCKPARVVSATVASGEVTAAYGGTSGVFFSVSGWCSDVVAQVVLSQMQTMFVY